MELSVTKLNLVSKGAGSFIYTYGQKGQTVVLKMVTCNSKESKHLLNEHTMLKKLHHPNVITPFKFKQNVSAQSLKGNGQEHNFEVLSEGPVANSELFDILVLEHAEMGSLMQVVRERRLSIPQIRSLFHQVCEAVEYLHCNYIVHRDIKLENIFVAAEQNKLVCKLGDFGFASSCYSPDGLILFNSYKGTKRGYMAPEIHELLKEPENFYDGRKSDVFALGVLMFAMVMGRLPFEYATMQNNLYKLIVQENYEQFWREHAGSLRKLEERDHAMVEDFKQLFISMVKYDAQSRVNMQDVIDDEWFNGKKQEVQV